MIINNKIYLLLIIMILVKNKLKKIKNTIDDVEMLNYLKYSHLEPIREDDVFGIEISDKATQFPDIMNNFTQTDKKVMVDKETDTYDELNKMDINAKYVLEGFDAGGAKGQSRFDTGGASRRSRDDTGGAKGQSRFDKSFKNDKQTQVNSYLVKEFEPKTPPSSNSEDEGFMSRNVDRGLRIAQLTGSAMLTALNIADTVGSTVLSPVIDSALDYLMSNPPNQEDDDEEVEEVEEEEVPTGSADIPQHSARDRSRSRDNSEDDNMGHRLLQRGASRSNTPSSGMASSAKTTPRKKSK